jgi:hypothetical protein
MTMHFEAKGTDNKAGKAHNNCTWEMHTASQILINNTDIDI